MRGCLTLVLFLLVAAACGYSIWQLRLLRRDVDELQQRVVVSERADRESMLEHAREALEALGRGEFEAAEEELDRLGELIEQARSIAADERDRLTRRLAAAREALAERSATAVGFIQGLVQDLSPRRGSEDSGRNEEPSAEP